MNQLWRRNIKKADKAGVEVTAGTRSDLAAFHRLYLETAARDGFTGRPLAYFETMWDALTAEHPDRLRLYLARHEGDLVAATTWVRVGTHSWYSYGASSDRKREVRGSNAIQWRMITDALAAGAVYDLRGITEAWGRRPGTRSHPVQGGHRRAGRAIPRRVGQALNRALYRAFLAYLDRGRAISAVRGAAAAPVRLARQQLGRLRGRSGGPAVEAGAGGDA
jgi:hypothetical protein